jgi:hypothetical protein
MTRDKKTDASRHPPGWDEERVRHVIDHYEQQNEEEAVTEDEAGALNEKIDTSDIPELDEAFFREAEVRLPDNTEDKRWGKPHPTSLATRRADGETDDFD